MSKVNFSPAETLGYHFKIVISRDFDTRNCNTKIDLENLYDSAKIEMVGISDNSLCSHQSMGSGLSTSQLNIFETSNL